MVEEQRFMRWRGVRRVFCRIFGHTWLPVWDLTKPAVRCDMCGKRAGFQHD